MVTISDPVLSVHPVAGHPGRRRIRVSYDIACGPSDPAAHQEVTASVVVHAVDEHDAAALPRSSPVAEADEVFSVAPGTHDRVVEWTVDRTELDVEQDWWSTDHGGDPRPIAEWLDHLRADIRLDGPAQLVVLASTPTVTGSWGALGDD